MEDLTVKERQVLLDLITKEMEDMEKYGRDFTDLDYMELREAKKKLEQIEGKKPEV